MSTFAYQSIIDKYYPEGSRCRQIYMHHCRQVANKALSINQTQGLGLDPEAVEAAAMLHDIGIFLTDAPGIDCHGTVPYLQHGVAGADLLRAEGAPEYLARVAERHTGSGLTPDDAATLGLPPNRCYMPQTDLERVVCYADKFFSKSGTMEEKSLERVRASMLKFGQAALDRFEILHSLFDDGGSKAKS